ncbi:o-succinylbenzoate synthase [Mesobacillus maritimus]|uniref:o-succinylbenzoate synthase n=1 Tax=Mesobacillus maritimus TaxID=1643336 RepID=UPI002041D9C6|nr:o-succinylbenzoate synthase [Mesobacillus maritimus]MCM3587984.1 o-succinylbenzoate synthase [Mesobacillus maritimus]MCM3670158.1 o-succinylbenzoate synthase [Mesobacillus maritimus]
MEIKSVKLSVIKMPLKAPFTTHLGTVVERESIIVEVNGMDGHQGYGEGVAFSSPWYTEETVQTSYHMLKDFLIPYLKENPIAHPAEVTEKFRVFRRNQMAKAALETALWDLYARQENRSLSNVLGGTVDKIPSGVVVATKSLQETIQQIETYLATGYRRVKVKISPKNDIQLVSELRKRFPDLELMADANSAYTLKDIDRLKALDEYGLLMIEQPLAYDDIIEHSVIQNQIKTPICLDESIVTFEDVYKAIELKSCQVINIKIGRVGGLKTAIKIHDYCKEKGIPVWCGGMIEFGISRAHNIALASLPGFTIPGDISGSDRYWEEDVIEPEIIVENGMIAVPTLNGIGFKINKKRMQEVTVFEEYFPFN